MRPCAPKRCRMGNAKAAVLPVPVCAEPITSRPARICGIACAWIGVGRSYPFSATAKAMFALRPSWVNAVAMIGISTSVVGFTGVVRG